MDNIAGYVYLPFHDIQPNGASIISVPNRADDPSMVAVGFPEANTSMSGITTNMMNEDGNWLRKEMYNPLGIAEYENGLFKAKVTCGNANRAVMIVSVYDA